MAEFGKRPPFYTTTRRVACLQSSLSVTNSTRQRKDTFRVLIPVQNVGERLPLHGYGGVGAREIPSRIDAGEAPGRRPAAHIQYQAPTRGFSRQLASQIAMLRGWKLKNFAFPEVIVYVLHFAGPGSNGQQKQLATCFLCREQR